jgi:hypothetical protein
VRALATTAAQEDTWDVLVPGLCIRVSRAGRKTWFVRYRARGKHRRLKLGIYDRLDLATARARAREVLAAADAGEDPALDVEADDNVAPEPNDTSFRALAREVLAARARKGRKGPTSAATQAERERLLERELLPAWGRREAGSITRRDVV